MKFAWNLQEKEKYYQMAEQQLQDAGIDFMKVDRSQFGVQGWDRKRNRAEKVYISLAAYPYKDLSGDKKRKLNKLQNWECLDAKEQKWSFTERKIFMHSRLVFQNQEL